jgi:hypothetical protein
MRWPAHPGIPDPFRQALIAVGIDREHTAAHRGLFPGKGSLHNRITGFCYGHEAVQAPSVENGTHPWHRVRERGHHPRQGSGSKRLPERRPRGYLGHSSVVNPQLKPPPHFLIEQPRDIESHRWLSFFTTTETHRLPERQVPNYRCLTTALRRVAVRFVTNERFWSARSGQAGASVASRTRF